MIKKSVQFSILLTCLVVTALNQYVTYSNAELWLAGYDKNARYAADIKRTMEYQWVYARAINQMKLLTAIAHNEQIEANKTSFELDRLKEELIKYKKYVEYLQSGIDMDKVLTFEQFFGKT